MNAIPINHHLSTVSDGTNSAAYSYLANSPLVGQIAFANNGATQMTATKTYDNLNRLTGIVNGNGTIPPVDRRNYAYNSANQRTGMTNVDGSYWVYAYDSLGQVTSGIKYWSDGTLVAGQQFDYAFDTIGNRTLTQAGGDTNGANLRTASYTNNSLNQITSRDVPGYADVMGLTLASNTVNVNGTNAYQRYEYFREQVGTNNSSAAQWMGINVTAPGQTTVSGHQFLAKTPETFGYDADGNLTNDGRWSYYWDAENRLTNMTSLAGAPNGSLLQMIFTYDYQGRRIQKLVEGAAQYTNLFVYDGWNPIASLNPNASILASFMWGTGMSGSMQGAGGVGALLAENLAGNGVQFVAYDGNGNVAALVNAKTGTVTANYEYGPFGEVIRATGPMAKFNPFMFSTKFYDWESGLYYYGARYYNPNTGRWLSRDPMEEPGFGLLQGGLPPMAQTDSDEDSTDVPGAVEGGDNFYMFVANDPVQLFDFLGLRWKVTRNGGAKAPAVPEAGDTVAGLANLIGLNASEYQKWLTADPGTAMPTFANEILVGCGQFEIPNTVVAEWAGNLGGLGRWWVRWNSSVKYLGKLGFNVDNKHHSKGATEDLKALLQSTSNAKELHGLYFWGHGSAPYPSDGLYSDTGDLVLKFSSPGLNYHMALGLVFACDSNSGQTALMSGTSAQIWKGFTGTLVPWPFKAYHAKHYIRPGQQETH